MTITNRTSQKALGWCRVRGAGWKARAKTNWFLQIHFLFFLFGVLISDAGDSDLDDGRGDVVASVPIRIILAVL